MSLLAVLILNENHQILVSFLDLLDKKYVDCIIWKLSKNSSNFPLENDENINFLIDNIMSNKHKNFYIDEWFSQKALLNNNKIVIFVTHGELSSIMEACKYGKPLLVIPLGLDQIRNARKVVELKIGLYLPSLSSSIVIKEQIIELLKSNNDINIKTAQIFSRQGLKGKIEAVMLIEDILRLLHLNKNLTGYEHLISPDVDISYMKANNYDIALVFFLMFVFVIILLIFGLRKIALYFHSPKKIKIN